MDPTVFRGIERILIVIGAIIFGYLGYRLFVKGLTTGEGNLRFESKLMKVIFSGTGPGLFFMAFGAVVLVTAVMKGGASLKETTTSPVTSVVQPSSTDTQPIQPRASDPAVISTTKEERIAPVVRTHERVEEMKK
jgi:hypothetical protein